jgi:peroxiredoxin 2/4
MTIKVGDKIPSMQLEAYENGEIKKVNINDYRGKWVVLFFYPLDFTFVCPTEIKGFAAAHPEFTAKNTVVLGASTDSVHSHKAWFQRDMPEVRFPILADTAHNLSRSFGVLLDDAGIALRGTFVIDPEGVLQHQSVSALNIGRSVKETLRVLSALQTGGMCPVDWQPGQETLKV